VHLATWLFLIDELCSMGMPHVPCNTLAHTHKHHGGANRLAYWTGCAATLACDDMFHGLVPYLGNLAMHVGTKTS
jgi:hypothetical protein